MSSVRTPFRLTPLALCSLLALPALSHAEDLMLRIQADAKSGSASYQINHAAKGTFAHQPALTELKDGDLIVIGRDAQGKELFRRTVNNPSVRHAEVFDPKTGQIALAKPLRAAGAIEVRMPKPANLANVEVVEYNSRSSIASASPVKRISSREIDALISQSANRLVATAAPSGTAMLWESGATNKRMDLILIGDGFTAAELGKWQTEAKRIADGVLADPLFAKYKNSFNIRRVDVASAQSGVSEGGVTRNTALGVEIGCYNIERLVCADENKVLDTVSQVTAADGRDVYLVVANSSTYGGAAIGNLGTMTLHPQSIEVALHEIGHSAFKLADEYDYGTCNTSTEPSAANVTRVSSRANVKWASLIASSTPVPTQPGSVANGTVGIFQGADYCTSGKFRPTENSRMRALSNPWHAVNEAQAKRTFDSYTGGSTDNPPVINSQPASVTVNAGQTATFSVTATSSSAMSYQWRKNGVNIAGANAASYTTPATVAADTGSRYSVLISSSGGNVTSAEATLTVKSGTDVTPPSITSQPAPVTVNVGQTATFSVTASSTATMSYQWRKNGSNISGATSASYTTPATTAADNGAQYSVVVRNSAGSVTSGNALLTVKAADTGGTTRTGTLSDGGSLVLPGGTNGYYQSTGGGTFSARLTGAANTDFDLYLYKWNGSSWAVVAKSEGPTSTESLSYQGTPGFYYLELKSYPGTGGGSYSITYTLPM